MDPIEVHGPPWTLECAGPLAQIANEINALTVAACLAGAFVLPLVVFVAVIIANRLNPVCGTPADSGGCEMGLASSTITAIVPGVLIGIAVGLALGLRNSRQKPRS